MLIGNYNVFNKAPGRSFSGTSVSETRANWNTSGPNRNPYYGWANVSKFNGEPFGYAGGYATVLPQKSGGMAIVNALIGSGNITFANLAGGVNVSSSIVGSGSLNNSDIIAIGSIVGSFVGSGSIIADIYGAILIQATIASSGSLSGALGAITSIVASISSSGSLSISSSAIPAYISSDITSQGTLSPESLAAAVWNSVAASFNNPGTMGNKVNSAASAGDPWSTMLPSTYIDGQAGKILSQIQTLVDELHKIQGLNELHPVTTTQTTMETDDIFIDITGDGINSTTLTRS